MKPVYFTVGPSELYFTVPDHLKSAIKLGIPSLSHRDEVFRNLFKETTQHLKEVFQLPEGYHIAFTASATEIWERTLQNLVLDKSFHLVNGAFSKKFFEFSKDLKLNSEAVIKEFGQPIQQTDLNSIPQETELIALTHNETSTGAMLLAEDLEFVRRQYPNQLISLDIVSSAPSVKIDLNQVDSAYFSVQKCFGLPAGLGVWIYNDRCIEKFKEVHSKKTTGTYHSLGTLHEFALKNQTPETPNVLGIYLLNEVLKDLIRKGLETVRRESIYKSTLLYTTIERHAELSPFITSKIHRSVTTIVANIPNSKQLIDKFEKKNMIIGAGYGSYSDKQIRIANFPTHSKEQIEFLVDELENI